MTFIPDTILGMVMSTSTQMEELAHYSQQCFENTLDKVPASKSNQVEDRAGEQVVEPDSSDTGMSLESLPTFN